MEKNKGNQCCFDFLATENSENLLKRKNMLKKIILLLSMGFLIAITGCQEKDSELMNQESSYYSHLYDIGYLRDKTEHLSKEDLIQIHNLIAPIYQFRSELQSNWKDRKLYSLDCSLFLNDYIYQEMKMYLYEVVRFLSPEEDEYISSRPYVESIQIDPMGIQMKDDLYLIPIIVDNRDYVPLGEDPDTWEDKDNVYEQFFVVKKLSGRFQIVNFIAGYLSDKNSEVYSKIFEYTKENWSRSIYNRTNTSANLRSESLNEYLDFIEGDMAKSVYLQTLLQEKDMSFTKNRSNYDRTAAVNYAKQYTDNSANCSATPYNPAYKSFPLDCANFVSQCLKAGGFVNVSGQSGSCNVWYYYNQGTSNTNDDTNSVTWSTANGLKRYLYDCGAYSTVVYQDDLWNARNIEVGDPFFYDSTPPGPNEAPYYTHSMIVTKIANGQVYYSAHCNNRKDRTMRHATTPYAFWFTDRWTRGFHITATN